VRDVTDARAARDKLAERERRFSDVVEASGEYVWETDAQWRYTYLSQRVEAVLGFSPAEMLGRTPREFMTLGEGRAVDSWFAKHVSTPGAFRELEHRSLTKSGRVVWQSISGMPVTDASGAFKGYRGTGSDVTGRRLAEDRIQYLATRDALTGLPNRLLLAERAEQAIVAAARSRGQLALLSFDLDRFKLVNDSLGHAAGDALLRDFAGRLRDCVRQSDTVARLGGDEFVVLLEDLKDEGAAARVADKMLESARQPARADGQEVRVSTSIGIAYGGIDPDGAAWLKRADAALYQAKNGGRDRHFVGR
jgi:diguanylate cyclase (GGDEF)-like protein/PAS domain S-box-containing protein